MFATLTGALASPFVARLHATGLWAGKALVSAENASAMPSGFQAALMHGWPAGITLVGGIAPFLGPALGIFHRWWLPAPMFFLAVVISQFEWVKGFAPRTVQWYLALLDGRLARRVKYYARVQDTTRFEAASFLLSKLAELIDIYRDTEAQAPTVHLARSAPFGEPRFLLGTEARATNAGR